MRIALAFASCVLILSAFGSARAGIISITDTTTSTVVFQADGFENDTVGALTSGTPPLAITGTWAITNNGASVVTPGAYDGNNFMQMFRPTGASSGNRPQVTATAATAIPSTDSYSITFAYKYVSTGGSSTSFQLLNGTTVLTSIVGESDYVATEPYATNFYTVYGTNPNFTYQYSTLPITPGAWQTITIAGSAGSPDLSLTVNGVTQVLTGAAQTSSQLTGIRFNTGANNTTYYVDAVHTVPEPATVGLMACGLVGLVFCARRRQRHAG